MKKITAFLCVVSLMVSMSGCGGKNAKNTEKPLDITVWQMQGTDYIEPQYPENDVVGDWLAKKTGVNVDTQYGNDGGIWGTKYSRLVAGGNLPHVIICGAGQGPAYFAKMAEMDNIYELTPEIIKKYMPHVWERVADKFWENIKVNGKIYGVPFAFNTEDLKDTYMTDEDFEYSMNCNPSVYNDVTLPNPIYIRDDVLKMIYPQAKSADEIMALINEKKQPVGDDLLDIPIYSTKEYVDFLYKIRDLNLKTDEGKKVYAYGYGGADAWFAYAVLGADMVGYKSHNYTLSWNTTENKISFPLVEDVVKEAGKLQNKMLRDGVADKESIAQPNDLYKQKVLNGQYAIAAIDYVGLTIEEINRELKANGKSYGFRPFYTQVPNREGYAPKKEPTSWNSSIAVLKTATEEEFHKILNWIDVQFSEEFEEITYWGPAEAGLYTEENGVRKYKDKNIQKWLVEGQSGLVDCDDSYGLGRLGKTLVVAAWKNVSKWNPIIMYKTKNFTYDPASGLTFSANSEHVKNVKVVPPCEIWSSPFANVEEVVELWSKREQWEEPFIVALTAENDAEFEKMWKDGIKNVNSLVDLEAMKEKCTKATLEQIGGFLE